MSNTSAKSRYTQLMSWLPTFKSSPKYKDKFNKTESNKKPYKKESKLEYYKRKGN